MCAQSQATLDECESPFYSGYVQGQSGGARYVVRAWAVEPLAEILRSTTAYQWAATQQIKEEMRGRSAVYAVSLKSVPEVQVVVRRNRHGGLFGALTGEYFIAPTRAPHELTTSLRLAAAGIATPEIVAYIIYPSGILARSDVITRRLPSGGDFPQLWNGAGPEQRLLMIDAVALLLRRLAAISAWHADLNLKNIYIAGEGDALTAYLLDVDRVSFLSAPIAARRNLNRLLRSINKWRARWGLEFQEEYITLLIQRAEEPD